MSIKSNDKNRMKKLYTSVLLSLFVFCVFVATPVSAYTQVVGYWCDSYWSSTPCNYGGGNYNQYPNPTYQYYDSGQYQYPSQYYRRTSYNNYYDTFQYTYPAPTCSITYSSNTNSTYYNYGSQPITLSWYSSNAVSAYISNVGAVSTYGSTTIYPSNNTTYSMTVYGQNGTSRTCYTTYVQPVQQYYPQPVSQYYYQSQTQSQQYYPYNNNYYTPYQYYQY